METTKGLVTSVSQKEGKYGISLGKDNWFNNYGECPCKKGDEVEITFEVGKNGFKNIKEVKVTKKQETSTREFHEDKNASMLVSYAKDLVVAGMEKGLPEKDIKEAMSNAAEAVIEAYKKIKTGIGE